MGLMALFRGGRDTAETRAAGIGIAPGNGAYDASYKTFAGPHVSETTALQLTAVWACVSLISDGVASLPVQVRRDTPAGRKTLPSPAWLDQANPYERKFDFLHRVITSMLLDGNAFIYVLRDDKGSVVGLVALDPGRVAITLNDDATGYVFRYDGEPIPSRNLLHIPAFTRPGHPRGLSPIEYARQAIGLAKATEEYGARFFSQGTTLTGIITHPTMPTKEQTLAMKKTFAKSNSGMANSHAVGILTGGASWQSVTITPDQAQFLETRKFQRSEVANLFRVPAHMIDPSVSSTWGKGIEEQNSWFYSQTLMPWIVRVEEALSTLLPNGQYFKFDVDSRLRSKISERYAAYAVAVSNGFMSRDEVRAEEDMEPLPNGQGSVFTQPLNLGPVGTPAAVPTPDNLSGLSP
ncbi:phage portal protein [Streptomyces sp. NPDC056683]|uniref:phage portal protein n=1 Tax=Streptomyces sp. NPDC056683 TaxID=3345910 RepID=UPI00367F51F3